MEKFKTDLEKQLFEWLWKSQQELAKRCLKDENDTLEREHRTDEWPAMQDWDDLVGSSQAIFLRRARALVQIPDEQYLHIIRNNEDAMVIIDELLESGEEKI